MVGADLGIYEECGESVDQEGCHKASKIGLKARDFKVLELSEMG